MPTNLTSPSSRQDIRLADAHLVQTTDAAFADAARRAGPHLLCRPGCTQCCHGTFAISPLDALRLREGMAALSVTDPAKADQIAARAQQFLAQFSSEFPGDAQTGILDTSDEAFDAFEDFANDAACPALDPETGYCDLYTARPMTCRTFGPPVRMDGSPNDDLNYPAESGLAVCELCFTQAAPEEIVAAEMLPPFEKEASILDQLLTESPQLAGDTIIAYCLIGLPAQQPSS
jgi:Fe-S-cluster containining protein